MVWKGCLCGLVSHRIHCFNGEGLGTEWQVRRGEVMIQSMSKHGGGSLRKQLSEVVDVFWKSLLQMTGQETLNKLKGQKTVLLFLVILLLGFSDATLFYPG